MKKIADIMNELGFRPEGSDEVKKAFIKNLIKQAQVSEVTRAIGADNGRVEKRNQTQDEVVFVKDEQLSLFDKKIS